MLVSTAMNSVPQDLGDILLKFAVEKKPTPEYPRVTLTRETLCSCCHQTANHFLFIAVLCEAAECSAHWGVCSRKR